MIFSVSNIEETTSIGYELGKLLNAGDIICLTGDLGTGKTHITKGIAKGLGIDEYITSPTFTIVNEYDAEKFKIFHFDLYRLEDVDEFYAIGGEEYLQNGLCIFEWGEMIEEILPSEYIKITFSRDNKNADFRKLKIEEIGF